MKMLKKNQLRLLAVLLTLVLSICSLPFSSVCAAQDTIYYSLTEYQDILSDFNKVYNTKYTIASPEELSNDFNYSEEEIEDLYAEIACMNSSEFYQYILDAHNDSLTFNNIQSDTDNVTSQNNTRGDVIQHYYYSGVSTQYLYLYSNRVYVNGTCHYGSIYSFGHVMDGTHFPAFAVLWYETSLLYSSTVCEIHYKYRRYISTLIHDLDDHESYRYVNAADGDVWGYNPI